MWYKIVLLILFYCSIIFSGEVYILKEDDPNSSMGIKDTLDSKEARIRSNNLKKYIENTLKYDYILSDQNYNATNPTNPLIVWYISNDKRHIIEFKPRSEDSSCLTGYEYCFVTSEKPFYLKFENIYIDCNERTVFFDKNITCVNDQGNDVKCSTGILFKYEGLFRDISQKDNDLIHLIVESKCNIENYR